jgi:FixJ family two-component response regulator
LQAVVTDHNLAGNMTGLDLADYARERHPLLNIVVMSGKVVDPLPPRTVFLQKPFAPHELLDAVRG